MRRGLALAALVASAGCDSILRLDPIQPIAQASSYRKAIVINNRTGAMLADQPVSIALAADPDLVAHAQPDGSDLAFDDGTSALAYELVAYSAGSLDAWVRMPALAPGTSTIYLTYGAPTPGHDATQTWRDAYVGVWHLSGSGGTVTDSTRHLHDLASQGPSPPGLVDGIAGGARAYAGQWNCGIDSDGSLELDASTSFTFSAWAYITTTQSTSEVVITKGGSSNVPAGFDLELGTTVWGAHIADGTSNPGIPLTGNAPLARWTALLIEIDRGQGMWRSYLDGSPANSASLPTPFGSLASAEPMCFGAESDGGFTFTGELDEVRVSAELLSPEQISFEHDNLAMRTTVIDVGTEEPVTR